MSAQYDTEIHSAVTSLACGLHEKSKLQKKTKKILKT